MTFAGFGMKALGYSEPVAHKHTADPRIRRGAVLTFPGQCQRMLHPVFVGWDDCGHALVTFKHLFWQGCGLWVCWNLSCPLQVQ